jgi:DNA-binding transcriptional regulator YdaS (Cro superfamily)
MSPSQAIEHFGSQQAVADALAISQPAVARWLEREEIPAGRQAQLQIITGGKLRADPTQARNGRAK